MKNASFLVLTLAVALGLSSFLSPSTTTLTIDRQSTKAELNQIQEELARQDIQLDIQRAVWKKGALDQIKGVIRFDAENHGKFKADGLVYLRLRWETVNARLESLTIDVEATRNSSKSVNLNRSDP